MPFWRSPATSRPRCQGRVGFAFTGAKRTPLTEEAGGLGAVFPQEGQAEAGIDALNVADEKFRGRTPCLDDQSVVALQRTAGCLQ